MKKTLSLVLALALVCMLASAASAETVLKLSEVHAEGYPTTLADQEFARLVEEKTEGRIRVEVYSGGTLYGGEPDAIEALQLGDLAFARVSASPVANFVPALNAIQMPYLYKNSDHMWAVLNGEIGQKMLADVETGTDADGRVSGLMGLCWYDAGARSFYLTKEVRVPADFAGLKIRMQNNTMMLRMVELLGGTGVAGIGPGEVFSAIETAMVDGAENNWPTYQNMGDYNIAPFYILDEHTRVPEILLASKAVMDSLPEEDRAILRECAVAVQAYEIEQWALKEASSEEIVRGAGVTVVELTPEERAQYATAMAPLYEEFGAAYMDIITAIQEVGSDF